MEKIRIDLRHTEDSEEVHEVLQEVLTLPDYYGANLDALYDCLTDITDDTCIGIYEDYHVTEYVSRMNEVFADAEDENPHLCVFIFPGEKD